jgi:predicted kinase
VEKLRLNDAGIACEVVCRDGIHLELHGERYDPAYNDRVSQVEILRTRWLFTNGYDVVIIDACHHKRKYRDRWREICKARGWELRLKIFDTPVEECLRRAEAKGDDYIIPIIKKQAAEFEPLTKEEL